MENEHLYEVEVFKTQDFYLAVALTGSNIPLLRLERENSRVVTFVFGASPEKCAQLITQHWNCDLLIPTKVVFGTIRELKTRIHATLEEDNK